jgi:hypothetical protein
MDRLRTEAELFLLGHHGSLSSVSGEPTRRSPALKARFCSRKVAASARACLQVDSLSMRGK